MNNAQDPCVKYWGDWNRADKAIACRRLSSADEAMREADRDRAESLLLMAKPGSLPGVGCLIQHGARRLTGAIPDEMWRSLLFIGGRLKKRKLLIADTIALRQTIGLIKFLAVADDESLPVRVTIGGCAAVLAPDSKSYILLMLSHALDFMKRPRLV
jgi:hypothetical protein